MIACSRLAKTSGVAPRQLLAVGEVSGRAEHPQAVAELQLAQHPVDGGVLEVARPEGLLVQVLLGEEADRGGSTLSSVMESCRR